MKGTAHALTCIDSLPTAIRREINQLGGKYTLVSLKLNASKFSEFSDWKQNC